jgi:hypothetical protein
VLFLVNIYKNDVCSNLHDAAPWYDILKIPAQETAELSGTGNNERQNAAGFAVKLQIADTAQRTAGLNIDDFFLFQITESHKNGSYSLFFLLYDLRTALFFLIYALR